MSISNVIVKNPAVVDKSGFLYKSAVPNTEDNSTSALIYSKTLPVNGKSAPSGAKYLLNDATSYFSIPLPESLTDGKVSLVATDTKLKLYVYDANVTGSADEYTFTIGENGATLDTTEPVQKTALQLSKIETQQNKDLDGNGAIGGLITKTGTDSGILDNVGGFYRMKVAGETVFVVGKGLDKSSSIDGEATALRNTDGTVWTPAGDYDDYAAVSSKNQAGEVSWTIYSTNSDGVFKYEFDKDNKLKTGDQPAAIDAYNLAKDEAALDRDLNLDSKFGVEVETTAIDAKGGLWKAKILGSDFYVVDTSATLKGLKTGVAGASAIDLSGSLLDSEGNAWAPSQDYKVSTILKTSAADADATYSVYAVKQNGTGNGATLDKNDVVRFDFVLSDEVNFEVTAGTADGVAVTASELAKAEKDSVRDLNKDDVFGVKVNSKALDATGGLFFANSMGTDYLLVGKSLSSGPSKGLDLSAALLTSEGSSWMPDNVSSPTASPAQGTTLAKTALQNASEQWANKFNIVAVKDGDDTTGYDVFVKESQTTFAKYHFDVDAADNDAIKLDEDGRQELTIDELVAAEVNTKRNLNFDAGFGVIINSTLDAKAGLYKAAIGSLTDVYIKSESKLSSGSKAAGSAVDLTKALRTSEGEVWQPADLFTVKGAYTTSTNKYVVVASKGSGSNLELQKYTFDPEEENKLIDDESGDLSVIDLAALEKDANKDLNGDSIKGVKLDTGAVKDKVGGLYRMEGAGGQKFWVQNNSLTDIKDLSSALLNADGTAWDIGAGETLSNVVIKKITAGSSFDFELVTMTGSGSSVKYKAYEFDATFTLNPDESDVELSLIDLAKEEIDLQRDINGDKVFGAKINSIIDSAGKLYDSKIDNQLMVSIAATAIPTNKVTDLQDVLKAADGSTPWAVDSGFKLTAAKSTGDGFVAYAYNATNEKVRQYNFSDERTFIDFEDLTAAGVIEAEAGLVGENGIGRDISGDKVVGLKVQPAVDKAGALYKATVLGSEYFVVGLGSTTLTSGKDNATAVDLSRALLNSDGSAWAVATNYQVAGLVTTGAGDDLVYNLFSYKKTGSEIDSVTQTTWDKDFNLIDSVEADPANLTSLEKTAKRDLSGDGFVGFKVISSGGNADYKGVTAAKVFGDKVFYLAGNVKQGTANAALSLRDALLNEDGSPWNPDAGFNIKSVNTVGADRFVYATKVVAGKTTVNEYKFSSVTGQYTGDSKEMTDQEMATKEVTLKKDFTGEGVIGVSFVLANQTLNSTGKSIGINKVEMNGNNYFVVNQTLAAGKTSLAGVLFDAEGTTAWEKPKPTFNMTGVWNLTEDGADFVEVYGKDGDEFKRFRFSENPDGSYKFVEPTETRLEVISKFDFAKAEAAAGKDLNDDSKIGLKIENGYTAFNHLSSGVSLALGAAKFEGSDRVYVVGNSTTKMLSKMGAAAGLIANDNALKFTETVDNAAVVSYWKPDADYEIKSIMETVADSLTVYAKKNGTPPTYINYVFNKEVDGWMLSTTDSGTTEEGGTLSSDEMARLEVESTTKKDLTGDGVVGLAISATQAVQGLKKATIDSEEYYMVGASLASGTKTKPTDFTKVLMLTDGTTPWKPADGENITAWAAASTDDSTDKPETAAFFATVSAAKVYFDADYKLIEA